MSEPDRGPLLSSPTVTRTARWGIAAWSLIGVALLAFLVYRFVLHPIRVIFPPLVVALIIVYLLNPLVSRLERRGVPRIWGTFLAYALFLSAVGMLLAWLIPMVSEQVAGFAQTAPKLLNRATEWLADIGNRIGFDVKAGELLSPTGEREALDFLGRLASFTAGVLHVVLIFVLGPILAFYLTVDLPKIRRGVQSLIPARRRTEAQVLGQRLSSAIGGFFRGQLLVALFVGIASMLVLWIVGLPYWALVGLLTGLFNLIPLIGPFIGGGLAALIAFTTTEGAGGLMNLEPGLPLAVGAAVGLLIVQQIDNHIISPNIVARTVKLHPVTVMLSLLAGGTVLGLWGMLLAVPLMASVKILMLHYWDTRSSWPPGAPSSAALEEAVAAEAALAAQETAEAADPERLPEDEPELAREGATGHWWWRWRAKRSGRSQDQPEPAGRRRS